MIGERGKRYLESPVAASGSARRAAAGAAPVFSPPLGSLWAGVAALIDRAETPFDLKLQGIHLLAARRWREAGAEVPRDFTAAVRRAAVLALAGRGLLERVRNSCDGPIILMKGPEIAARYPDPALRSFVDLDILVSDADGVQRQLLAAGFQKVGDPALFVDIHHLRPLALPTIPLSVEVHSRPKWPHGLTPPPIEDLLEVVIDSATGVEGVLALPPAHHALLVAAHGWAHYPLHRLKDIVDIAVLSSEVAREAVEDLARDWALERVWRSSAAMMDSLLFDCSTPPLLRLWARHLPRVRERTVLENHLMRLLSPFAATHPRAAAVQAAQALLDHLRPSADESRREKFARSIGAALNPTSRLSEWERRRPPRGHA